MTEAEKALREAKDAAVAIAQFYGPLRPKEMDQIGCIVEAAKDAIDALARAAFEAGWHAVHIVHAQLVTSPEDYRKALLACVPGGKEAKR